MSSQKKLPPVYRLFCTLYEGQKLPKLIFQELDTKKRHLASLGLDSKFFEVIIKQEPSPEPILEKKQALKMRTIVNFKEVKAHELRFDAIYYLPQYDPNKYDEKINV